MNIKKSERIQDQGRNVGGRSRGPLKGCCFPLSGVGWRKDIGFQQASSGHVGRQWKKQGVQGRGHLSSPGETFQDMNTHVCHSHET